MDSINEREINYFFPAAGEDSGWCSINMLDVAEPHLLCELAQAGITSSGKK